MHSIKKSFVTISISCFLAIAHNSYSQIDTNLNAAATQDTVPMLWSLEDCLNYAQTHNYDIRNYQLSAQTAEQNYLQSKQKWLPSVSGSGSYSFNHTGWQFGENHDIITNGTVSATANMTLFNGGAIRYNQQQKNLANQLASLDVANAANNVILQITQAFVNILQDKELVKYYKDLVNTSALQLNQVQDKFSVGSVPKKDVIQIEAQLAGDKYNLTNAENNEKLDKIALKQLLLLSSNLNFDISTPTDTTAAPQLPPLNEVINDAIRTRPEISMADLNIKSAEVNLKIAKAGYLPTLSMYTGLGSTLGNTTNYSLGYSVSQNMYQQAGLSLSVPLFSNRQNKTNVENAKINIEQQKLAAQNTRITLEQTIEKAYVNTQNSMVQLKSANEQVTYLKEALRIADAEFKIGTSNLVSYVQQRNLYVQSLQQYIQAKYNALMYEKVYRFYRGDKITIQ